ncbi:MAG: transcriptional regulator [Bacteroidetes bacterium CG12_big_fil_rev_8_21_14_0_65_60_17]|nr:MAG: transcriptional regulator [Bacteroidetes bacterium CG12_big_fil_rev_8_21_14_0_65_60_17]
MQITSLKLVTIIAERILEDRLIREVVGLGAKGYTITDARGQGSRGVRANEWEGPDIRMELLVSAEVADRIMAHVADTYFEYYALIAFVQDADVARGDKYV